MDPASPPPSRRKKLDILAETLSAGKIEQARQILRDAAAEPPPRVKPPPTANPVALPAAAPGREVSNENGKFWLVRRRLAEAAPEQLPAQRGYLAVLRGARQRFDELAASPAICHIADGKPEGPLFLSIQACGAGSACTFLVGVMACRNDELVFDQLLARHYGEEAAILQAFSSRLAEARALVTFNGKAGDLATLQRAYILHVDLPDVPPHCDLRQEARRRWRGRLPDYRLPTLERHVCRRRRARNITPADAAEAYHAFVAGGDAAEIQAILHHNLLNLLTLGELLCLLLTGEEPDVDS